MCGIAGYFLQQASVSGATLAAMSAAIAHRGPDDEGFVLASPDAGRSQTFSSARSPLAVRERWPELNGAYDVPPHRVGLAHVRYSIIDLSPAGHQPMWSPCGQVCLTFNGEIYNYQELRQELTERGLAFRTASDTEVLLNGYLAWGDGVLERLNGFFALALYDARKPGVMLARDRLGKAHLYLRRDGGRGVYWASEIKALRAASCISATDIDVAAVSEFIVSGRRDRGGTFWKDAEDFPPAHFAWFAGAGDWEPRRYWDFPRTRWAAADISLQQASERLADLLADALRIRFRADVPLALELSGGVDSSSLVGLAAGRLGKHLTTCTVEFEEEDANEEPFARAVAQRYPGQIDYRVIRPSKDDFWRESNEFVWLQEEPFHSPNLHTNQQLRRVLKRAGMDVVITGAAADEMLAGYPGDYLAPFLRGRLQSADLRGFVREIFKNTEITVARSLVSVALDGLLTEEARAGAGRWRSGESALLSGVLSPAVLAARPRLPSRPDERSFHGRTLANLSHRLMNYWLRSGAKADYGIPIETRAPFLDYRVVELCCQLPPEYLIRDGWHKYVLRNAVRNYLPRDVTWRRTKMGFPFPYRQWLQASSALVRKNVVGLDCPFIDGKAFLSNYDALLATAPITLWRILCVLLWWRRVIEQETIMTE
jgi:asparagine synthase (glutamine-hydrolysing)